jgi:serine/threonine protein kinase
LSDSFRDELNNALEPNYTIQNELSGGGMSRVFVAVEHALNRKVVIKVLKPDLAAGVNRDRFRREIMLVAQLHHPHIVPVLTAGERDDLLWYTMPFVEGESLRELIRSARQLSPRDVTRVLHDVLDALDFAHTRGVIHRDIKPGNILRQRSHSLVTDFGVAKALSAALPHSGATSAGMAIGTPAYMAPEQIAADPKVDHRVDLYAVGLLAYELLTGKQPFAASSPQETLAAQLTRMPTPLAEVRPDLAPGLSALITRLLAKNPNDRPPTAAAALEELDGLTTPSDATPSRATTGLVTRTPTRRGRFILVAAAVAAIAVVAFALLGDGERTATTPASSPAQSTLARPDSAKGTAANTNITSQTPRTPGVTENKAAIVAKAGAPATATAPAARASAVKGATPAPNTQTTTLKTKSTNPTPAPAAPPRRFSSPRRVAVLPVRVATSRPDLAATARALTDSLRKAFTAAGYTLATDADLVQLLSEPAGSAQRRAAQDARIGSIVSSALEVRSGEVRAQAMVLDVWRGATLSATESADLDKPLESLGVVRDATRALDRVSWRTREDPRAVILFDIDNQTGADSLAFVARQIAAAARAAVAQELLAIIVTDSTALATKDVMERREIAVRLKAGALVAGTILRARNDSITIRLAARDLSEDDNFPTIEARVPIASASASASGAIAQLIATLRRVNWGPKGER